MQCVQNSSQKYVAILQVVGLENKQENIHNWSYSHSCTLTNIEDYAIVWLHECWSSTIEMWWSSRQEIMNEKRWRKRNWYRAKWVIIKVSGKERQEGDFNIKHGFSMFCIHYFDNTLTEMCLGALSEESSVLHSETMQQFISVG